MRPGGRIKKCLGHIWQEPDHAHCEYWFVDVITPPGSKGRTGVKPSVSGDVLHLALEALGQGGEGSIRVLDQLAAAIYMTDAEGVVTYYNDACIRFAGRRPVVHQDSWCVTWRLYTEDGEYIPHDQCPMAVAIRERRPVRGVQAVAQRPDGSYVGFQPFPTPLLDREGRLLGAINLLHDLSGPEQAHGFRARAEKCRHFVNLMPGQRDSLLSMAADYDEKAQRIEQRN